MNNNISIVLAATACCIFFNETFGAASERKRYERIEGEHEYHNRQTKVQRIDNPAVFVEDLNRDYQEIYREQFFQARAVGDIKNMLHTLSNFKLQEGNPDDLISPHEYTALIIKNDVTQTYNDYFKTSNKEQLSKLQQIYISTCQYPELNDRIKTLLQNILLLKGRNEPEIPIPLSIALSSFSLVHNMYAHNLLYKPEEQNPLAPPQTIDLGTYTNLEESSSQPIELPSTQSLQLLTSLLLQLNHIDRMHSLNSNYDTVLNFLTSTIEHIDLLRELRYAAQYLGLQPSFYNRLLALILQTIREKLHGNFMLLEQLPYDMKMELAAHSALLKPIMPLMPFQGSLTLEQYHNSIEYQNWKNESRIFYNEKGWRNPYTKTSVSSLAMTNKIPPISTIHTGQRRLNLSNLQLESLDGLADIPDIATVEELILANNSFIFLPGKAFDSLPNLRILNLSNNQLRDKLSLFAFDGLSNLTHLNLSNNNLRDQNINMYSLTQLPALNCLDISGNCITRNKKKQIEAKIKKVTNKKPKVIRSTRLNEN